MPFPTCLYTGRVSYFVSEQKEHRPAYKIRHFPMRDREAMDQGLEHKACEFVYTLKQGETYTMKFDVTMGNLSYQPDSDGTG